MTKYKVVKIVTPPVEVQRWTHFVEAVGETSAKNIVLNGYTRGEANHTKYEVETMTSERVEYVVEPISPEKHLKRNMS